MSRNDEYPFLSRESRFETPAKARAAEAILREGSLQDAAGALGKSEGYLQKLLRQDRFCQALEQEAHYQSEREKARLRKKITEEWKAIAFADAGDYFVAQVDEDGKNVVVIKNLKDCPDTRAIAEVAPGSGGTFKLKLYDKAQALQQLEKLLGLSDGDSAGQKIQVELKGEVDEWAR